jgi:hypothetical protein
MTNQLNRTHFENLFGAVRYSMELTQDASVFHTVRFGEWSLFVSEYDTESMATLFKDKELQLSTFNVSPVALLDEVNHYVNN